MDAIFAFAAAAAAASWELLADAAPYVLFGIVVAGLLRMFLSTEYVARHLGHGRAASVFKAALFGIPLPLCSCGVLPAAATLKKQGANNGATTAFLISTPESGVDSISITWALLDPLMTLARPVAAFVTALVAGLSENFFNPPPARSAPAAPVPCPVDNCCDGIDCSPGDHIRHHSIAVRLRSAVRYAFVELWGDLAGWFLVGILLAGVISAAIPDGAAAAHLGGGLRAMLLMLAAGVPLYICATASTPIAAALILKGVSPGAALVFLLAGPATNVTSLSVLVGMLGRRATALYLAAIAIVSVAAGLALDAVYGGLGLSARATVGRAAEILPAWAGIAGALLLLVLSARPVLRRLGRIFSHAHPPAAGGAEACGCSSETCGAPGPGTPLPLSPPPAAKKR